MMSVGRKGGGEKGTGNHLLMLDQALRDFSKAVELPPTATAVPGERVALGNLRAPVLTPRGAAVENKTHFKGRFPLC